MCFCCGWSLRPGFVEAGKQPVAKESLATGCLPASTKPAKPPQPIGNPLWCVLLIQTIYMWKLLSGTTKKLPACYNSILILEIVSSTSSKNLVKSSTSEQFLYLTLLDLLLEAFWSITKSQIWRLSSFQELDLVNYWAVLRFWQNED